VVDFLFLGLGPISRNLIKSLCAKYPSRKIVVLSSGNPESWWPLNVSKTSFSDLSSSNNNYNFIFNSWKNLDNDKLILLSRFKQFDSIESYFINFSTVGVYGNHPMSVAESSSSSPINLYGHTKRNIEVNLKNLGLHNLINLRISNVFGDPAFQDFINLAISAQMKSENIKVVEPSLIYRDFLYIEQLVKYLDSFVEFVPENPEFWKGYLDLNVASGLSHSLQNIIDKINYFSGLNLRVTSVARSTDVIERSLVNASRLKEMFPQLHSNVDKDLDFYIKHRLEQIH
jgi:hypothetical protein